MKKLLLSFTLCAFTFSLFAQEAIIAGSDNFPVKGSHIPVEGKQGMVVASEPLAAKEALAVLKEGGNAIDAAVTMGFVLAVTMPRAGNLGGGGFMLVNLKSGKVVSIDYREKAPIAATADMFLDKDGNPDPEKSRFSPLSAGVPGSVAGMHLALKRYGTISWAAAIAPAIALAEDGFEVSESFAGELKRREKVLERWPSTKEVFFKRGRPYEAGEWFKQPDLAKTLKLIAEKGPEAFYRGEIADQIVATMAKHGGLITKKDLQLYYPAFRVPIRGMYRGYDIFSMGPPSSGGVHLIQILNILEGYSINKMGHNKAQTVHVMAEAMKYAYADRSKYMGDMDFVKVPLSKLTNQRYADNQRKKIKKSKATPSSKIRPTRIRGYEGPNTTHFSIIDSKGNAVSNTTTLNFSFGSGIVVEGAGFLLNNEMDDFSAKPGVANAYGLIGGSANKIEPKKRMLSSMSPTIVKKRGKLVLLTGSPGGSRIITTVTQVVMNVIDHKMNIQEAVNAPRMHHQWMPDILRLEEGFNEKTVNKLKEKGHEVEVKGTMGAAASIMVGPNGLYYGASDPRRDGLAIGY